MINFFKYNSLIYFCFFIFSCQNVAEKSQIIESNEFKTFISQKNRFELNSCELKYNQQVLNLGMNLLEIINILGKETSVYSNEYYKENTKKYFWSSKGIEVTISNLLVTHICIFLKNEYLKYPKVKMQGNTSIVFNNTILNKTDKMHEYVNRAKITFNDIGITSNGYTFKYDCNDRDVIYSLDSPVAYHDKIGYLNDDWELKKTNEINSIHISYKNKDQFY